MAQEYRLTGADRPNVPIPSLAWVDKVWKRRLAVVGAVALIAGIAGVLFNDLLDRTGLFDTAWQWPVLLAGAVASLGGVILSFMRVDQVPRVGMMEERSAGSKGVRASARTGRLPRDSAHLRVQDYMAVEMVQYGWPMIPALVGMILVLIALWTVAPAVVVALLLVAVWAAIRINGTATARKYYRLRKD
ncbi:hypothetical protein [Kocuria atrinae]|uniref:hypothetical protein n=1 Tax=Kocuria atrinae TaxID=592377 RepID=UPI0003002700|nr:hypothetical protein [Kocuria atrinae]